MKTINIDITEIDTDQSNGESIDQELINAYSKETNDLDFVGCPCHCVDFVQKLRPVQLKKKGKLNVKIIEDALKNLKLDFQPLLDKYKKECYERRRNICVFVFLFDTDVTQCIYITKMGFVSVVSDNPYIVFEDYIASPLADDIEPDAGFLQLSLFPLPCPKLMNSEQDDLSMDDVAEFLKMMCVVLARDKEAVPPVESVFEGCELSNQQRVAALNLFIASACKDEVALRKITESLVGLVKDSECTDKGFCMSKLMQANPYYRTRCTTVDALCLKITESVTLISQHFAQPAVWKTVPMAVKSLVYLLKID